MNFIVTLWACSLSYSSFYATRIGWILTFEFFTQNLLRREALKFCPEVREKLQAIWVRTQVHYHDICFSRYYTPCTMEKVHADEDKSGDIDFDE